jgi:hypothetical protein
MVFVFAGYIRPGIQIVTAITFAHHAIGLKGASGASARVLELGFSNPIHLSPSCPRGVHHGDD